jgi:hypothetical protein
MQLEIIGVTRDIKIGYRSFSTAFEKWIKYHSFPKGILNSNSYEEYFQMQLQT